ncbi:MAG: tetratricopeptide repeat protein [Bacteroidota bacterium]
MRFFTAIPKICLILIAIACNDSLEDPKANQLLDYWNRKVELSQAERKELALQAIETSDDHYLKAISNYIAGNFTKRDGDYNAATMHYLKAAHELKKSGMVDHKLLGHIYRVKGSIAVKYKLYNRAINLFDSAFTYYSRYPEDFVDERLATLYNKGLALLHQDNDMALKHFEMLYRKSEVHDKLNLQLRSLRHIGEAHTFNGQYEEALISLQKGLALFEELEKDNDPLKIQLLQAISKVHYYENDFEKQQDYLKKAIGLGSPYKAFLLQLDLGESLLKQGQKQEAHALLTDLEKDYDNQVLHPDNIRIYELMAEVSTARGAYLAIERKERAKYDKEKEAIMSQGQEEKLQLMAQQMADQIRQDELKEAVYSERRDKIIIAILLLISLSFMIVAFVKYMENRTIDKELLKKCKLIFTAAARYNFSIPELEKELDEKEKKIKDQEP